MKTKKNRMQTGWAGAVEKGDGHLFVTASPPTRRGWLPNLAHPLGLPLIAGGTLVGLYVPAMALQLLKDLCGK